MCQHRMKQIAKGKQKDTLEARWVKARKEMNKNKSPKLMPYREFRGCCCDLHTIIGSI